MNLRSQIFSASKEQSTAGNTRNAHFLNKIANSLTDDIGALQYGEAAWQAGINWDNSDRFNFYSEPTPTSTPTPTP